MPPHVELDEDGSIPQAFLKYDPDWRNALHQFQVDLEAGRYDSTWLDEAALAMEERAAGVYDSFKETEFEEFWGQKQKVKVQLSGETASLKLADLIHANLFQVGDVWSYTRNVGKLPCERVQVEKECMVRSVLHHYLHFMLICLGYCDHRRLLDFCDTPGSEQVRYSRPLPQGQASCRRRCKRRNVSTMSQRFQ